MEVWSTCIYKPFSYLQLTFTDYFCSTPSRCVCLCPSMELQLCSNSSHHNVMAIWSPPIATTATHLESSCKGNCPSMWLLPCHATSVLPRWFPISLVLVLFVRLSILMPFVTSHSISRSFAQDSDAPLVTCVLDFVLSSILGGSSPNPYA